jgi:hypothetical protein
MGISDPDLSQFPSADMRTSGPARDNGLKPPASRSVATSLVCEHGPKLFRRIGTMAVWILSRDHAQTPLAIDNRQCWPNPPLSKLPTPVWRFCGLS